VTGSNLFWFFLPALAGILQPNANDCPAKQFIAGFRIEQLAGKSEKNRQYKRVEGAMPLALGLQMFRAEVRDESIRLLQPALPGCLDDICGSRVHVAPEGVEV
jgi:hypothetical protein